MAGTVSAAAPLNVPICKLEDTGYVLRMVTQAQYDRFIADDDGEWKALETFYIDNDGDGYAGTAVMACEQAEGMKRTAEDCDDTNAAVHPGATEVCTDGIDNDCNGTTDTADAACSAHALCIAACNATRAENQGRCFAENSACRATCEPNSPCPFLCNERLNECLGASSDAYFACLDRCEAN
jgi:hypothetical protein